MAFTLSPTCKALDTNMGGKKKRKSNDLHRQVRMGMEREVMLLSLVLVEAQSPGTVLTTGGSAKGAGEWLPVRLLIEVLGENIADDFRAIQTQRDSWWRNAE